MQNCFTCISNFRRSYLSPDLNYLLEALKKRIVSNFGKIDLNKFNFAKRTKTFWIKNFFFTSSDAFFKFL